MKAFMFAAVVATMSTHAWAAMTPRPGVEDARIQTIEYDPRQVVTLRVALGYALTLEFAPDERIQNVSVGNGAVWQVTPNKNADHLFVKPMQGAVTTDMSIVTDTRTYVFELVPLVAPDLTMPFVVRYTFPVTAPSAPAKAQLETSIYRLGGARALQPLSVSDDGRSTSIIWATEASIPAIYAVDPNGHEALVNGGVRDGKFVVDQIADRFNFRSGRQSAFAVRHVVKVGQK